MALPTYKAINMVIKKDKDERIFFGLCLFIQMCHVEIQPASKYYYFLQKNQREVLGATQSGQFL